MHNKITKNIYMLLTQARSTMEEEQQVRDEEIKAVNILSTISIFSRMSSGHREPD